MRITKKEAKELQAQSGYYDELMNEVIDCLNDRVMTIETKYNIGNEVWLADSETKLIKCRVKRIRIDVAEGVMNERYDIMNNKWCFPITMPVCVLFPTKEELLKSL